MGLHFEQLFDNETSTYTYLVADKETKEAALFDTVQEHSEYYIELLEKNGFRLKYLIETHVHADHVTANSRLREKFPDVIVALHANALISCSHKALRDGEKMKIGSVEIVAMYTPGHTGESMSFLVNGDRLLTGDTFLIGSCGRTDFQAGDSEQMFESLQKLASLPGDTLVYPGHDYNGRRVSSIAEQKSTNRLLKMSLEEFKADLASWNLPPPKKIKESVPANLKCGQE